MYILGSDTGRSQAAVLAVSLLSSAPRKQSLAGLGQALPFVRKAFLPLSSRQQRLSRKNFDVAKESETYREEGVSEHLFFFSFFLSFFFSSRLLVINNAFTLLWLCSRRGENSLCLQGREVAEQLELGGMGGRPRTRSFLAAATACHQPLLSSSPKETRHDICFLHAVFFSLLFLRQALRNKNSC